jgi:hypothetical protein
MFFWPALGIIKGTEGTNRFETPAARPVGRPNDRHL